MPLIPYAEAKRQFGFTDYVFNSWLEDDLIHLYPNTSRKSSIRDRGLVDTEELSPVLASYRPRKRYHYPVPQGYIAWRDIVRTYAISYRRLRKLVVAGVLTPFAVKGTLGDDLPFAEPHTSDWKVSLLSEVQQAEERGILVKRTSSVPPYLS